MCQLDGGGGAEILATSCNIERYRGKKRGPPPPRVIRGLRNIGLCFTDSVTGQSLDGRLGDLLERSLPCKDSKNAARMRRWRYSQHSAQSFTWRRECALWLARSIRLFSKSEKQWSAVPQFLACLFTYPSRTLPENISQWPSHVRSPGQVRWALKRLYFQSCSFWNIITKHSGYHDYKYKQDVYFSFSFRWSKVRSILQPPYYKGIEEKKQFHS